MSPGRRSREAAAATRERVLASARQLIQARGVHAVTLEHVARAIGMTRGAVYVHFRSRAELMAALLTGAEADLEARLARLDQTEPPGPPGHREAHPWTHLEPVFGALLHDGGLACHASLLWALLQHRCTDDCELCPLRARILRRALRLRRRLAMRLPDARHATLLMAHLWGVLSVRALQLVPASGLDACAASLARLYGPESAVAAIANPVPLRDTP
jgi:TetR/AcrR family acrAB operon transcriptional repressor